MVPEDYDMDFVNDELKQMVLTEEISEPISSSYIYSEQFGGNYALKKIDVSKRAKKPDTLITSGSLDIDSLCSAIYTGLLKKSANIIEAGFYYKVITALLKNTDMDKDEIYAALEITDERKKKIEELISTIENNL